MKLEVIYVLELDDTFRNDQRIMEQLRKRALFYYRLRQHPPKGPTELEEMKKEDALLKGELDMAIRKFMMDERYTHNGIKLDNFRFNTLDVVTPEEEAAALAPIG